MNRILGAFMLTICFAMPAIAQAPPPKTADATAPPSVLAPAPAPTKEEKAPTMTNEQHANLLELVNTALRIYISKQQYQKKYDEMMKQDPEYIALDKQDTENGKKLQDAVAELQKNVDSKKWTVDLNTGTYKPVEAPKKP